MRGNVLIVDDERSMCDMIAKHLKIRDYEYETCTSPVEALERIREGDFDVVLTDINMPGMSGIELCTQAAAARPDLPFIIMTAFGSLETAVDAIRAGAYDFVTKPITIDLLLISIERAIEHRRLYEQVNRLNTAIETAQGFGDIVGKSTVMRQLFNQLTRITESDASILLTGESGTGKELVARNIHKASPRKRGPFVPINCGALPETLIESELFGHVKGAFTDAKTSRKGLFLEADGGTLFLDEIGELPPLMQVKLLRALEERKVRPIGGDQEIPFDVRVISATNRDLESAMEENTFREDLYYRINVIQLNLPPLRNRGMDIIELAQLFLKEFAEKANKPIKGIAQNAAAKLLAYTWPGNVRQLRNVIERAVALAQFDTITLDDLPETIRDFRDDRLTISGSDPDELTTLEDVERRYILHVLKAVNNNKTQAAKILGLDRKTLYRKLAQYQGLTEAGRQSPPA